MAELNGRAKLAGNIRSLDGFFQNTQRASLLDFRPTSIFERECLNRSNRDGTFCRFIEESRLQSNNLDEMFFEDWNSTEYKNFKNSSNQDGTLNFDDYRLKQSTKLRQNNSLGFYSWLFSNKENLLSYDENNFNFIVEFYS